MAEMDPADVPQEYVDAAMYAFVELSQTGAAEDFFAYTRTVLAAVLPLHEQQVRAVIVGELEAHAADCTALANRTSGSERVARLSEEARYTAAAAQYIALIPKGATMSEPAARKHLREAREQAAAEREVADGRIHLRHRPIPDRCDYLVKKLAPYVDPGTLPREAFIVVAATTLHLANIATEVRALQAAYDGATARAEQAEAALAEARAQLAKIGKIEDEWGVDCGVLGVLYTSRAEFGTAEKAIKAQQPLMHRLAGEWHVASLERTAEAHACPGTQPERDDGHG